MLCQFGNTAKRLTSTARNGQRVNGLIPYRQYSERMAAAYNSTQHFQSGQATTPMQAFAATLDLAVEQKVDLLVLGGGISSVIPLKQPLNGCKPK
ncbi:metallophosphoesterase [Pseudomonas putida ND6]|uniref:Metallophosphoesterase n=1 Tax=Pseudomonas putida ND6 TaxID=231023 RepID=I3UR39_PSEPU|nr:metallophosphoesterase [Pseudomonas putida ND6]